MDKDKKYTVYKHTSPEGKIYIGCTGDDPEIRWRKGYQHNVDFTNDIERIGWDNFNHDIIASNMNENDAYELEKELIHAHQSNDPSRGYNKSTGGKKNTGVVRSDEYRRMASERAIGEKHPMYGKKHSEESKRKMSESTRGRNHPMYGKHLSEEHKRKLSVSHKKENLSEETLRKMREAHLGKPMSDEAKRKIVETGVIYNSIGQAAESVGRNATNITAACNGRINTSAGYHWKHVKEKENHNEEDT